MNPFQQEYLVDLPVLEHREDNSMLNQKGFMCAFRVAAAPHMPHMNVEAPLKELLLPYYSDNEYVQNPDVFAKPWGGLLSDSH